MGKASGFGNMSGLFLAFIAVSIHASSISARVSFQSKSTTAESIIVSDVSITAVGAQGPSVDKCQSGHFLAFGYRFDICSEVHSQKMILLGLHRWRSPPSVK